MTLAARFGGRPWRRSTPSGPIAKWKVAATGPRGTRTWRPSASIASAQSRVVSARVDDGQFLELVESLTSLAIRSPMTRAAAVGLAERLRGPLPEWERNSLIAANLRDMHRRAMRAVSQRGKATAILSPHREFVFGDGFYHNLTSGSMAPSSPRILAPLTPRLAVLYAIPRRYTVDCIIIGPSLHPDVIRQPLEAELRSQEVAPWDQLVCVSDIPLRHPG